MKIAFYGSWILKFFWLEEGGGAYAPTALILLLKRQKTRYGTDVGFTVNEIVLTRKFSGFHNRTYFCLISFSVFVRRVESLSHNSDVG